MLKTNNLQRRNKWGGERIKNTPTTRHNDYTTRHNDYTTRQLHDIISRNFRGPKLQMWQVSTHLTCHTTPKTPNPRNVPKIKKTLSGDYEYFIHPFSAFFKCVLYTHFSAFFGLSIIASSLNAAKPIAYAVR